MDRGAWKATVHGVSRVRHNLVSKQRNKQRSLKAFLSRRECLLISWLQSLSTVILETKKIKSATVSIFSPSICHEVTGLDGMILVFLNV